VRILVIGGTGFISRSLVKRLLDAGHRVTIFTRGRLQGQRHQNLDSIVGDRTIPSSLEVAGARGTYDAVYDMIAYEPDECAAAVRIFRGRVGRFIHCSTISVYMVSDAVHCPITEDQDHAPLMKFWERNPFGMEYGIKKRQCEDVLWHAHDERLFPVSMMRPTYVSGPHDPARRDWFWIERIIDGGPLLVPGSGGFRFQQVYIEDVSRMFHALLEHPVSIGRAYNIAGEETFSLNEYLQRLGTLLGRSPELVHLDQEEFDRLPISVCDTGDVFAFNARRNAVFSLDRITRDLHYRSTPFDDWMALTVTWWTTRGGVHSNGYAHRSDELAAIRRLRMSASHSEGP
jgi:nucleoside-diphosphate-sugar epimerase